ncbi:hypothetical protein HXX76_002502 [Chlamydomonas incerta]|uniref:Subtilisin n=1 Tax=Chlamydomonas incerta TaxID=51695 RepID=A0A835TNT7_CHLIN|nr:hypothetical protein HXX76_002502 [Chlamydomonas incerta]|eukprot:KAG2442416.1 hypothetical protein HXX76_002502 [Chlamydomonas incerta]
MAASVARQTGAPMADYGPNHCLAPEWQPLLQQLEPSGTAAYNNSDATGDTGAGGNSTSASASVRAARRSRQLQRQRNQLLHSMATLDTDPGDSGASPPPQQQPRYGALVELVGGLADAALSAAERDWPGALAAAVGSTATPTGSGSGCWPVVLAKASDGSTADQAAKKLSSRAGAGSDTSQALRVYLCEQDLAAGVLWLAGQPVVRWVEPQLRPQSRNAVSSILLQTGAMTQAQYDDPLAAGNRPFWDAGLRGEDEVVGVGDTGLDLDHCFYADPRFSNYPALLKGTPRRFRTPAHRKVVQYVVFKGAKFGDEGDGHGTHVCGSVAGAAMPVDGSDTAEFVLQFDTGGAPRARLSFNDIGGVGGALINIDNVDELYLPFHKNAGAAITSDSWGPMWSNYDGLARRFDAFLWRNPDMTSFIAAGNSGDDNTRVGGTVDSPANAKNVVGVGVGYKYPAGVSTANLLKVRGYMTSDAGDVRLFDLALQPAETGGLPYLDSVVSSTSETLVGVATPIDACEPLYPEALAHVPGRVVLVSYSDRCDVDTRARNLQDAGAAAMMMIYHSPNMEYTESPELSGSDGPSIRIPVSSIPQVMGGWLVGNLTAGTELRLTWQQYSQSVGDVVRWSGYGPTRDGRIKPDIISPGYDIVSAKSTDGITGGACHDDTQEMSGTSMATPLAAGSAALLRQYLKSGFYPGGWPDTDDSTPFKPSGILVKALVIAGAKSLQGGWALQLAQLLSTAPDYYQGWGRLDLLTTLPLRPPPASPAAASLAATNASDDRVRMQVADYGLFTETGQEAALAGITATGTGPITIVLVWYDYPANENTDGYIVNDLDLLVTVAEAGANGTAERCVWGNNREDAAYPTPDRLNTVERVLLVAPPAGAALTIRVRAANLPSRLLSGPDAALPQRWAVVALGHLGGTLASPLNPAYARTLPSTSRATFAKATQPGAAWAAPFTAIRAGSLATAIPPPAAITATATQGSVSPSATLAPAAPAQPTKAPLAPFAALASQPGALPAAKSVAKSAPAPAQAEALKAAAACRPFDPPGGAGAAPSPATSREQQRGNTPVSGPEQEEMQPSTGEVQQQEPTPVVGVLSPSPAPDGIAAGGGSQDVSASERATNGADQGSGEASGSTSSSSSSSSNGSSSNVKASVLVAAVVAATASVALIAAVVVAVARWRRATLQSNVRVVPVAAASLEEQARQPARPPTAVMIGGWVTSASENGGW